MKLTIPVFITLVGVICFSCSNTSNQPFEAHFTGEYTQVLTGDKLTDCDTEFDCRVMVAFKGTSQQFGDFSGQFNFCACGPEGKYAPTQSYMIFSAGDTLIISCHGKVVQGRTEQHAGYVTSYWQDPFVFKGGTGRFEGASGGGTTDDYNSSQDPNSHHRWVGNIVLKK